MRRNMKTSSLRNKEIRDLLFLQCGGYCPECGKKIQNKYPNRKDTYMTIDHIIPKSKGGKRNYENVRPLCRKCNAARGNDRIPGLKYFKANNGTHIVLNGGR